MPCPKDPFHTDAAGRAFAGSQRQIQTYVNNRASELSQAIVTALEAYKLRAQDIHWVSPLAVDGYSEYRDKEFLDKIGASRLIHDLDDFWPRNGPCWDALARLDDGGCILVEAKSHVSEVRGNGCGASDHSLAQIKRSIDRTKSWLAANPATGWLGDLYQSANRLAFLYFLREIGKINAYLINAYFIGDPHSCFQTTRQQWDACLIEVNGKLGINDRIPFHGSVFLDALP